MLGLGRTSYLADIHNMKKKKKKKKRVGGGGRRVLGHAKKKHAAPVCVRVCVGGEGVVRWGRLRHRLSPPA